MQAANLELRRGDILDGPVAPGGFDLVTVRGVLHDVADADAAIANLVSSMRPGGAIVLVEPDFLPVSVSEPAEVRDRLAASGALEESSIEAFLAHCADPAWWTQTIAFTVIHGRTPST